MLLSAAAANRATVSPEDRAAFHVPDGGVWYYRQAPALDPIVHPATTVVLVWDKTACGKRLYGVYQSHETLWRAVTAVPLQHRHGYELIREHDACKFYLDFELYVACPSGGGAAAAAAPGHAHAAPQPAPATDAGGVTMMMKMLEDIDLAFRAYLLHIKQRVAELARVGFLPSLTVLHGTRPQNLSAIKAVRMGFLVAEPPPPRVDCLKISFHIIAQARPWVCCCLAPSSSSSSRDGR